MFTKFNKFDRTKCREKRKFARTSYSRLKRQVKPISIFLLSLCLATVTTAKGQTHNYDTNFQFSQKHFVDTIPIIFEKDQIYIEATVGGRRCLLNFDTGSSQGAVFGNNIPAGSKPLGTVLTTDANGRRDTVGVVGLPAMTIGPLRIDGYVASVFRRQYIRGRYDAILGFDVVNKGLCVKIDTRKKIMILTDRRDFFDGEPGFGLHYKLKWFVPYLMVSPFKRHVDEVRFDTGASQLYAMNKQSFDNHAYKSKNVESQVEGRSKGSFTIGTLGAAPTEEVAFLHLDRLKWGQFRFTDVHAVTTQGASRIGASMLRYGTVTINGFRRKITFQPYDGGDSVVVDNRPLSVAFVPYEGRAAVGVIYEESDPYKAGMRQGDVVLAVNGHEMRTFQQFLDFDFQDDARYVFTLRDQQGKMKEVVCKRQ